MKDNIKYTLYKLFLLLGVSLLICALIPSCKTVQQQEDVQVEHNTFAQFSDSLWRIICGRTTVSVNDSAVLTLYRPDGTIAAQQKSWHNENSNSESKDSTFRQQSASIKKETVYRKITIHTKQPAVIPFISKLKYALFGMALCIIATLLAAVYHIWKNK